ncbi:hypothetical protein ACFLY7_00325 [Patescibacteria group bacterium]
MPFLEKIQKKSDKEKKVILFVIIFVPMSVIITWWITTLNNRLDFKKDTVYNKEKLDDLGSGIESIVSVKDDVVNSYKSLKTNFKNYEEN